LCVDRFSAAKPALPFQSQHLLTVPHAPLQAAGNLEAFPTFYAPLEPESRRPPHDVRVRRFAHRLRSVLASPHVFATKAVLASSGDLVAIALWHRPGAPVRNTKRRGLLGDAPEGESEADREAWAHVDLEAHERVWREWDETRERIMGDTPHWCASRVPPPPPALPSWCASERATDSCSLCAQTSSRSGSSRRTRASASARRSCSR